MVKLKLKSSDGYILLYIPNHPRSDERGYVKEHIVIMEKHIGQKLDCDKVIHHINGIKTDNRIENLKLMSNSEHMKYHALKRGLGKHKNRVIWNKGLTKLDNPNIKGGRKPEKRFSIKCVVCGTNFKVTKNFIELRKYCSQDCVYKRHAKKRGEI